MGADFPAASCAHQGPTLSRTPGSMLATTRARPDRPIVGRRPTLQLDVALDGLRGGEPACIVVEGEPGIGKTRLLAELCRRAEDRGHVVLAGPPRSSSASCRTGSGSRRWTPTSPRSSSTTRELLDDRAVVLPSLGAARQRPATSAIALHRAMRQLLALLAEDEPVVLVLDDLHWSDAASVDLIGALVRRGMPPRRAARARPSDRQGARRPRLDARRPGGDVRRAAPLGEKSAER